VRMTLFGALGTDRERTRFGHGRTLWTVARERKGEPDCNEESSDFVFLSGAKHGPEWSGSYGRNFSHHGHVERDRHKPEDRRNRAPESQIESDRFQCSVRWW